MDSSMAFKRYCEISLPLSNSSSPGVLIDFRRKALRRWLMKP
uniref:Uncharacterized protein n=1 Tax=Rhizophora mucronata TaxID=61149 RepID=A0A2P2R1U8_RHIMU